MAAIPDFQSLFRLDGKVALITGGAEGIGFIIAAAYLQSGAEKVIITSRKEENLKRSVDELNAIPGIKGRASYIVSNISTVNGVENLVEKLKSVLPDGKLHILVNNAAASWGGSFETFEDWKVGKTLDVNVRAVFNLTQKALPLLEAAGSKEYPARNLIVSSVGGMRVPLTGSQGAIVYCASKAAATHLGRQLAMELAHKNIVTNIICPGWFKTRLAGPAIEKFGGDGVAAGDNPMGRLGLPGDMAGIAVYLAAPAGNYVNGEDISVDGGKKWMSGGMRNPTTDSEEAEKAKL